MQRSQFTYYIIILGDGWGVRALVILITQGGSKVDFIICARFLRDTKPFGLSGCRWRVVIDFGYLGSVIGYLGSVIGGS